MRIGWRSDGDDWTPDWPKITDPVKLAAIKSALEEHPIIVEHWHYRGSRSPDRLVFDAYEAFEAWLGDSAFAGDIVNVWDFAICRDDNMIASGKCPDDKGEVPRKGPY